jgi:hypothetical protein
MRFFSKLQGSQKQTKKKRVKKERREKDLNFSLFNTQ